MVQISIRGEYGNNQSSVILCYLYFTFLSRSNEFLTNERFARQAEAKSPLAPFNHNIVPNKGQKDVF